MNDILTFTSTRPELAVLGLRLRVEVGASLQAVIGFGSTLSPQLQQQGSIPDVLALVDDVDAALRRLGEGWLVRTLATILPPIILAYRQDRAGPTLAKLNLIAERAALHEVAAAPDLYLAGRLSKPVALLWARDAAAEQAALELHRAAIRRISAETMVGLAGDTPLAEVVTRAVALAYRAELRPEGAAKFTAIQAAFPEFYTSTLPGFLREEAKRLGFGAGDMFHDRRDPATRVQHRTRAQRLLRRSRVRILARLVRQLLVYRGALDYVRGKLRRVRAG